MFVGHVGAGLWCASRSAGAVNAGWFVGAALLQDLLLWVFLLTGLESGHIPPGAAHGHEVAYRFPYSHGLLATLLWSVPAAAAGAALAPARARTAAAAGMALAVVSHGLLDVLVHRPQLPLAGPGSPLLGLGLWDHMALALAVELAVAAAGLAVYLRRGALAPGRRRALVALCVALALFTAGGLLFAPPPPSVGALALSSLAVQTLVCLLVGWIARARAPA